MAGGRGGAACLPPKRQRSQQTGPTGPNPPTQHAAQPLAPASSGMNRTLQTLPLTTRCLTSASSLPASLRYALVHLTLRGLRFILKFLWHLERQKRKICDSDGGGGAGVGGQRGAACGLPPRKRAAAATGCCEQCRPPPSVIFCNKRPAPSATAAGCRQAASAGCRRRQAPPPRSPHRRVIPHKRDAVPRVDGAGAEPALLQAHCKREASGGGLGRAGRSGYMRRCYHMLTVACHTRAGAGERPCVRRHSLLPGR